MRVQSDKRNRTHLATSILGAPPISGGSGALERIAIHPHPDEIAASPADREATDALLAHQCRCRIDGLAPRQRDVLAGLVGGQSNKQIARTLGISPRTIEIYRAAMMTRLEARSLAQALHIAFVAGLASSDMMSPGNG